MIIKIAVLVHFKIVRMRNFGPDSKDDTGPKSHLRKTTRDTEFLQILFWTKNWTPYVDQTVRESMSGAKTVLISKFRPIICWDNFYY